MTLAALVALLALADPAPAAPAPAPAAPSRTPLRKKIDPDAMKRGLDDAAKIEAAMRATKAYPGQFKVAFSKVSARVEVVLVGGSDSAKGAREQISDAVVATGTLASSEVTIIYLYDGPCTAPGGDEILRRESGAFVVQPERRRVDYSAMALDPIGGLPCVERQ